MGITLYSRNKAVPREFSSIIKPASKVARFCIGRRVRDVPIGLIIYAGRNQYCHADEEKLKPINASIFNLLAHGIKGAQEVKDPAFDLENKNITIYSDNILSILEWNNFEAYITDMEILLNP
jgi:hypothetical protein